MFIALRSISSVANSHNLALVPYSALQRGQLALKSISAVVVDGNSGDGTVKAARRAGAQVKKPSNLHSRPIPCCLGLFVLDLEASSGNHIFSNYSVPSPHPA